MPSFIFIRPTVWPQYTVTDIQTGQERQRSDSIGQTVLQTIAQIHKLETVSIAEPLQNRQHARQMLSTLERKGKREG